MDIFSSLYLNPYKKRIEWIDLAKALSIFIIVYAHTYITSTISSFVHLFHVPVFFFLSGLVWRDKEKGMKDKVAALFRELLVPYYVCASVSAVFYRLLGRLISDSVDLLTPIQCLEGIIYANSRTGLMAWNRPLWFIPCLFSVKLIWGIITHFVKSDSTRRRIVIGIFFLGILISYGFHDIELPYELEIAFVMLGFYWLGSKSGFLKEKIKNERHVLLLAVAMSSFLICYAVYKHNSGVSVQHNEYGAFPLFLIGALAGIIMIITISGILSKIKLIQFVGQNTITILLWHKYPVLLFQISHFGKECISNQNSLKSILIGCIVVAAASMFCIALAFTIKKSADCFEKVIRDRFYIFLL